MTEKEKKDFLSNLSKDLTDAEIYDVINGAFEKVIQTAIQPLSLIPNSTWNKWDDFVLRNRLNEKMQKILYNAITNNISTLAILKNDNDVLNKIDVVVPVSNGQITADRGGRDLVKTSQVIAEQTNLLYDTPADTKMISYIKKKGVISKLENGITSVKGGGYDYADSIASSNGFVKTDLKTIPIVWFTSTWLTSVQKQMLNATKKTAFLILKELIAQLELAGPNLLLVGSSNNSMGSAASAMQQAILKKGSRVNKLKSDLSKSTNNPIINFNNQPWFQEFWEQIESMVNTLIEGLQVGDMNQGGKGTANMHTTEVATSFGVKAQKIINIQNMFLSSWDLMAKILRENGIQIPAKVKFTYDSPDNLLVNQIKQTTEDNIDEPSSENKGEENGNNS